MRLRVFSATAAAPTSLAAFDRALQAGGVQDTNLLSLSSVVPVGATVVRESADREEFVVGDRLYCVMAEQRCVEPGEEAWAGLGWVLDLDGRGGLFVESHGRSEHHVRLDLATTLEAMISDRPYLNLGDMDFEVIGLACERDPVCALVMAIYESAPWASRSSI
jgi:arginine decarboxylase